MTRYTGDLMLRTVTDDDVAEVAKMWAFEKGKLSREEAQGAIAYMQGNHAKNRPGHLYHLCFAVYEKGQDAIIGWCGLDGKSGEKLHIFYMIDARHRGKGYATQCAKLLLACALEDFDMPFVNGGCYKDNVASYRVMEKAGMERAGMEDNGDPLFYMDKDAYQAKQKRRQGIE